MKIHYNYKLKHLARHLRNKSTLSEVLLWNELKARQLRNYQFMRQKPIGDFIVDFYCSKLRLAIEIDGESHDHEDAVAKDQKKDNYLNKIGITVLRFDDIDVKKNIGYVLETIEDWIDDFESK